MIRERLRDRARLSGIIAAAVHQEAKHGTGPDLEQRVRDRLERQYGETPTWQLILELLLRLLPLLLEKPPATVGAADLEASDLTEEQ